MSRQPRWNCQLCRRTVAYSAFKRHVSAHENNGIPKFACDSAWREFLDATGWPRAATKSPDGEVA